MESTLDNRIKMLENSCNIPGQCRTMPIDREIPLARSIQIQPTLEERRNRAATAAESRRMLTQKRTRTPRPRTPRSRTPRSRIPPSRTPRSRTLRSRTSRSRTPPSRTPNSRIAEFVNDLENFNDTKNLTIRPRNTIRNLSMIDNYSKDARIKRTVQGDRVAPLIDYMRAECVDARCAPLQSALYYSELKNSARYKRQKDLKKKLVRTDIPRSRQQRTLRSRQHDVADRLSLIDEGLDQDVMNRVHQFLKKKGHDIDVNKRYLERRGW